MCMKEWIRKDIINILKSSIIIVEKENIIALEELSNHTIHDASIFQDKDTIKIAVIIYALSKIIKRGEEGIKNWKKAKTGIVNYIKNAKSCLERGNKKKYKAAIGSLLKDIGGLDDKLKLYIDAVLDKARIVKGSKLYAQGVSIERASDLLGVSQWELMSYVGKTNIVDNYKEEVIPVKKRLNLAKRLFGL